MAVLQPNRFARRFAKFPPGARKEEAPNPWAAKIRSCGKAKDLEGALQLVEEEAALVDSKGKGFLMFVS